MSDLYALQNVPIFSTGTWNSDVYAESDLDAMAAAYGQVGFKPPLKLGHDESQPFAKSDGMPALGWVTNLRRVGKQLVADFRDIPRQIYDLIRRKAYNHVSAEVYWDYEEGGRRLPRVLKAVALLGAEIPAVTSLAALESLYDASGKPFRRYDFGADTMPGMGMPMAPPMMTMPPSVKKDKASVNYQQADEGGYARCGACKCFEGPPDPDGDESYLGGCYMVSGEVCSSFTCDLQETRDAFRTASKKNGQPPKKYQGGMGGGMMDSEGLDAGADAAKGTREGDLAVRPEGDQFCVYKGEQKLECFATQEEADALVAEMSPQGDGTEEDAEDADAGDGAQGSLPERLQAAGEALIQAADVLGNLGDLAGAPTGKKQQSDGDGEDAAEDGADAEAGKQPPFGEKKKPPFGGKGKPFAQERRFDGTSEGAVKGWETRRAGGGGATGRSGMLDNDEVDTLRVWSGLSGSFLHVKDTDRAGGRAAIQKLVDRGWAEPASNGWRLLRSKIPDIRSQLKADGADALFTEGAEARTYVIERRGKEWCLMTRDGSKTLGCHASEAEAMAQERAVEASKNAAVAQAAKTFVLSRDLVRDLCPGCADQMDKLKLSGLKVRWNAQTRRLYTAAGKTFAFNEGLCAKFGAGEGFRTRCMESDVAGKASDAGAFCNALKEFCFGDVTAGDVKKTTNQSASAGAAADGAQRKGARTMAEELENQELKAQLAALTEENKALAGRVTTAEAQAKTYADQAKAADEQARKDRNGAWIASVAEGPEARIIPAERPYVEYILDALTLPAGTQVKAYALQMEGKEISLDPAGVFKRLVEMRSKETLKTLFTEQSKGGATATGGEPAIAGARSPQEWAEDPKGEATRRAKVYAKAHGDLPFRKAYRAVLDEDRTLKDACANVRPEGAAELEAARQHRTLMHGGEQVER